MATNPEFGTARPAAPVRQKLSAAWRWWSGEIARLLPERFSMLRGGARVPMVLLEGDDVLLASPPPGGGEARTILGPRPSPPALRQDPRAAGDGPELPA